MINFCGTTGQGEFFPAMSKVPITNLERGGIRVWKIIDLFK